MPTLGNALDFSKYEARNLRGHQLGAAPSSPVTGQLYYNTGDNTLYWYDGSAWVSARGGASATPPATTGALGTIQLAGDLAGTATSPQIAAGVITDADVNAANKDGVVGTASMRTLGAGAQQAMPGNRTLDAITAPAADVAFNSKKITGLADPTAATDGANKQYVDGLSQGVSWKAPVLVLGATAISGGAAPGGAQTIDGVVLANNDRVLLVAQSSAQYNGIWSVSTSSSWTRVSDANTAAELLQAAVFVEKGTTYADTAWVCTTDPPIVVDTTALTFVQFTGMGALVAGAGLTKTGNQVDVGAGAGITVAADTVGIATGGVTDAMLAVAKSGYYSTATHGAGTAITITQAVHGCRASRGLLVQCLVEATGAYIEPDISVAANGDVTATFGVSQSANTIRTTIVG